MAGNFVGRCTKNAQGDLDFNLIDESDLKPGDVYRNFQDQELILYMKTDTGSVVCEESDIPIV